MGAGRASQEVHRESTTPHRHRFLDARNQAFPRGDSDAFGTSPFGLSADCAGPE